MSFICREGAWERTQKSWKHIHTHCCSFFKRQFKSSDQERIGGNRKSRTDVAAALALTQDRLWPQRQKRSSRQLATSPSQLSATQLHPCMGEEGNTCVPVLNALALSKFHDFWANGITSGINWKTSPKQTKVCSLVNIFALLTCALL